MGERERERASERKKRVRAIFIGTRIFGLSFSPFTRSNDSDTVSLTSKLNFAYLVIKCEMVHFNAGKRICSRVLRLFQQNRLSEINVL